MSIFSESVFFKNIFVQRVFHESVFFESRPTESIVWFRFASGNVCFFPGRWPAGAGLIAPVKTQ